MDFKDAIKQLSVRVKNLKDNLHTEEATKTALIMPFLNTMGYDVFNPMEIMPEFTCDIGTKKGEKVDYAILKDDIPIMLIECKHWKEDLTLHDNQLIRYFTVSNAKFGILTNGITYKFYTDLVIPNKMDEKPFFEIDFTDLKTNQIEELKKFHKTYFDLENILNTASELKYTNELKAIIVRDFANPSPELVKLLAKQVYDGSITQKIVDQFTSLVRKSITNHINDIISERFKTAIEKQEKIEETTTKEKTEIPDGVIRISENGTVFTTQEELEAFYIVRSILRQIVSSDKITYKDFQSYFAIYFDNNSRMPICRLYFSSQKKYLSTDSKKKEIKKYISTFDQGKKETKYNIQTLDEIYGYSSDLIAIVKFYRGETVETDL